MAKSEPDAFRVVLLLSGHLRGFGEDHVAPLRGLPRNVDIYAFAWVDRAQSGVESARAALEAHCKTFGGSFQFLTAEQSPREAATEGVVDLLPIEWMWLGHRRASQMYLESVRCESEPVVFARARFDVESRIDWKTAPGAGEVLVPITDKWGSLALPTDMFVLYGKDVVVPMSEIWAGVGQLSREFGQDVLLPEQYLLMHLLRQGLQVRVLAGDVTLFREHGYRVPVQMTDLGRMRLCNVSWQLVGNADGLSRFAGWMDEASSAWLGVGEHDSLWPEHELKCGLDEKVRLVERHPSSLFRPLNLLLLLSIAATGLRIYSPARRGWSRVELRLLQALAIPLDPALRRVRTASQRLDVAYQPSGTAALQKQTSTRRRIGRNVPFSFRIYRRFVLPSQLTTGVPSTGTSA